MPLHHYLVRRSIQFSSPFAVSSPRDLNESPVKSSETDVSGLDHPNYKDITQSSTETSSTKLKYFQIDSDGPVTSPLSVLDSGSACGPGSLTWMMVGRICFSLSGFKASWIEAENVCEDAGGHLASIADSSEARTLERVVRNG